MLLMDVASLVVSTLLELAMNLADGGDLCILGSQYRKGSLMDWGFMRWSGLAMCVGTLPPCPSRSCIYLLHISLLDKGVVVYAPSSEWSSSLRTCL